MSFGGGFGGFGSNQQQQSSGFGGFGAANNNNNNAGGSSLFGANNNATPSSGGGLFGNNNNNNTSGGFGGGFGSANTGGFGANKPATTGFGSNTGGGLFGSGTANTGNTGSTFGGFGGGNTTNTSAGFGSNAGTGGGGLFGSNNNQAKPGFGATGSTGFGTSNSTGFGSGGFGAPNNPGLGGGTGDPPGTAQTPFQAHTEKEANATNAFQNILFQEPYRKWSTEELRLADYAQGRRHGNGATGGAGAFGVSSGFGGGFGSNQTQQQQQSTGFGTNNTSTTTGGGLFGSTNNNTTSGFGQTNNAFGANNNTQTGTAGGLFGSKPAATTGGGLFGNNTAQSNTSGGGGLFGSSSTAGGFGTNNASTGFGANNNNNNNAANNSGTGLFGANNQQQKPAGLFGSTANNTSSGFGSNTNSNPFGSNTTTNNTAAGGGGGLFGSGTAANNSGGGGGLFGNANNNQQQQTTGGFGTGFGQNNQTQQTGNSLFGNNQAKPATGGGLFGSGATNTTQGGLFGNANQQQQQNTGGFGANNATATGGGLFGNKPATGGGLFNNAAQTTNTGGGLFGAANNQAQQSTGGGLFGSANNNQQKPGGMFGSSTTNTGGGGLFGNSQSNQGGGGLFGASNNQQQQNPGLGNSLLGNSQQANTPQSLTANLNDVSAFGSPSLFAGVGGTEVSNPGPLATPLNGGSKPRRTSILPMYKLAPASASRMGTPQRKGYGFSYSTLGTPTGASPSNSMSSTPGALGRSLLGSSSSGSLSKSVSHNSLRRTLNGDDSILAPGAFSSSTGPKWYGSSGSKKLVINRELRSDLFSTPTKEKTAADANGSRKMTKRVSFSTNQNDSEDATTPMRALPAPEDTPGSQDEETPRQNRSTASPQVSKTSETDQTNGDSGSGVERDAASATPEGTSSSFDNAPGAYWTNPPVQELHAMNRVQRQKIDNLEVGRENIGSIQFKLPVDLSGLEVDDLLGKIIQLEPRSATVYPVTAKKPPVGKGLNVPARITLEQSWPRSGRDKRVASDPKRFNKHVERLKRIPDTEFESYDKDTGVWVFHVEHFTTYGLDDSDDETDADMDASLPSEPPVDSMDEIFDDEEQDDTFAFKQSKGLPGAFEENEFASKIPSKQSFFGDSSADSAPNDLRLSLEEEEDDDMDDEYDVSEDEDMARSSPGQHQAAEHDDASSEGGQSVKKGTPGGILRARMRAMKESVGPVQLEVADGDDWAEMLRKSVSPVKRDRQLLRDLNTGSPSRATGTLLDFDDAPDFRKSSIWKKSTTKDRRNNFAESTHEAEKGKGFATSIDLMNSLFEKPKSRQNLRASVSTKGFPKFPYERQDKNLTIEESEQNFHNAGRPTWGPDEMLVVPRPMASAPFRRSLRDSSDILTFQRCSIHTATQDLRIARFATEPSQKFLRAQLRLTDILVVDGVPSAKLRATKLHDMFHDQEMTDPSSIHEKRVWELASILFDDVEIDGDEPSDLARKNKLSQFWTDLVDQASSTSIGLAGSSEDKAVACLAGHRITEACKHLFEGKNFRLATLVPLIGTSDEAKEDMRLQIKAWHGSKMLSEVNDSVRTVYELLSGNVCACEGMKGSAFPVEDCMEPFIISEKFGLDWKRAFGLRLWYAISKKDDLGVAVSKYSDDINQGKEALPQPWFAEQGIRPLWKDVDAGERQDVLWGLLQLYADPNTDLEAVLRPENSQLSPLDMRLSWQLGLALSTTGRVTYGQHAAQKADAATVAYASQLTSAGEWLEAIFVLLHLSDSAVRKQAIQEHLCRHAGLIGAETSANFATLLDNFQIPATWVWEAGALYMRSVTKDPVQEVHCLLRAGAFVEAHRVLSQQVAPQAIVERDYTTLMSIISQFQGNQHLIPDWQLGGEIYSQFLALLQHRAKGEIVPRPVLDKMLGGLHAISEAAPETEMVRYAAISDMADETAREILKFTRKKQNMELRSRILQLPLTQDRLLTYSVDLGMERYKEVMSH